MTSPTFSERMKGYETRFTPRLMPLLPTLARLDGRNFHKFTKALRRPYDARLAEMMIDLTSFLVKETGAILGYTQSDEISLVWYADNTRTETCFGGKVAKMTSVMASMATAHFNEALPTQIPEKRGNKPLPVFDNRVWQVPTLAEAAHYFRWRQQDAIRNSVQMAARSVYSHSNCKGKKTLELKAMLLKQGINWENYFPHFRHGSFLRRERCLRTFTPEEIEKLPRQHDARTNPNLQVLRTEIKPAALPPLAEISNLSQCLFAREPFDVFGKPVDEEATV